MSAAKNSKISKRHYVTTQLHILSGVYGRFVLIYILLGEALRLLLLEHPTVNHLSFSFSEYIGIFGIGLLNDFAFATIAFIPLFAFSLTAGNWKFRRPQSFVFLGLLVLAWLYVRFGAGWLHDFNRGLHRIIGYVLIFWIVSFALRMRFKAVRTIRLQVWFAVILALMLGLTLMNVVGEWLFWNEFGVRYNFIAVDYLVYTQEVVGNIVESYPVGLIGAVVVLAVLILEYVVFGKYLRVVKYLEEPGWRIPAFGVYVGIAIIAAVLILFLGGGGSTTNMVYKELRASGPYSFCRAFFMNELDYRQFYSTLPDEQVEQILSHYRFDNKLVDGTNQKPNIVLVTIESMSADFMERFGNEKHLTPVLDSLYNCGLSFDRMFAAGNRTVRGLEALTLSRPPSPGESIIKREVNTGYPSTADILDREGYHKMFFYGGDSYFDNMESFFSGMGYEIVDSKSFADDEVQFRTIWGICDEDVFSRVIKEIDARSGGDTPVYAHIMTTSNHRPYTYPEGKVAVPPSEKSREGAVMYSDYALGRFISEASRHKWFDNTVFVFVADHCASSAGSVEIPLENYHIPCVVYAPKLIEPQMVGKVSSQIDVMPTVFALVGLNGSAGLYGRNILSDNYKERAFVSTYQDLGYLENDTLTVLSPAERIRQYRLTPMPDNPLSLSELSPEATSASARAAISFYQSSSTGK